MTQRLTEAIFCLRYRQIKALLDQGVGINNRLDDGRTPLMITLEIPDVEKRMHMFRFLLHHGADMLESDNNDVSIFQHCCRLGYLDLMDIILKRAGVSAVNVGGRDKHGRTALYHSVTSQNVEVVNRVLDHTNLRQQSVDVPDDDGLTPLLYAKRMGLTDIADVLIDRGKANPRICDRQMHMNADEWGEAARRREQEAEVQAKNLAKERYMIFPPIDHATRRKEKISKRKSKAISMPNLTKKIADIKTSLSASTSSSSSSSLPSSTTPVDTRGVRLPSLSQSNVVSQYPLSNDDIDLRTKSIDSAITLLGIASQTADDKQYAQSFVSSQQHKPIGHAQSKSSNRQLQRTWATVMDAYSVQNTGNFRKPAKAPTLPDINADDNGKGSRSKMSTLAIIMRGKVKGKNARGKHKLNSISESAGDGDHRGKLSRRKTSTLSMSSDNRDGKSKSSLPGVQEDDEEWVVNKKKKDRRNSSRKQDALPNITVS